MREGGVAGDMTLQVHVPTCWRGFLHPGGGDGHTRWDTPHTGVTLEAGQSAQSGAQRVLSSVLVYQAYTIRTGISSIWRYGVVYYPLLAIRGSTTPFLAISAEAAGGVAATSRSSLGGGAPPCATSSTWLGLGIGLGLGSGLELGLGLGLGLVRARPWTCRAPAGAPCRAGYG